MNNPITRDQMRPGQIVQHVTTYRVRSARWPDDGLHKLDHLPLLDTIGTPQTAGLDTPWVDINRIIGGIQPGTLTVIGGRPATGKSMLGLNLAEHVADKHNQPVLFCSLEMLARELGMRRLANATSIDLGAAVLAMLPLVTDLEPADLIEYADTLNQQDA